MFIFVYIMGANETLSSGTLNYSMDVNMGVWSEAVVAYWKILPRNFCGLSEKKTRNI
jgi:hypothetical protein